MLSRQQQSQPQPHRDDRERITRARQAAEALFTSKPPVSRPSVPDSPPTDQAARKPRVLGIIAPPTPMRNDEITTSIAAELQTTLGIPQSQFARIRTLVKYGMTVSQVALLYGAAVADIKRILRRA